MLCGHPSLEKWHLQSPPPTALPPEGRKYPKRGLDKVLARVYNAGEMAKYDSMRKLERNKMLREFAEAHPELSNKEIGRSFDISESRVWRVLHGNKNKEATGG